MRSIHGYCWIVFISSHHVADDRRGENVVAEIEANLKIDVYGQRIGLERAVLQFHSIKNPNVFSWTILLKAYAANGHLEGAKATFDQMPEWNVVSWTAMLQAYARTGDIPNARKIFDTMRERNVVSWNSMISAYAKLSRLEDVEDLFAKMPERSIASWNILLSAYSQSQHLLDRAIALFESMASLRDIISWNTMIFAFVKFSGFLNKAKRLFDEMPGRNLVTYTCLLDGFAKAGHLEEAKLVFDAMPCWMTVPWASMLHMYVRSRHCSYAIDFFSRLPEQDVLLSNILLSMHSQNGDAELAKITFDGILYPDIVSWTNMLQVRCDFFSCSDQLRNPGDEFFEIIPSDVLRSSNACWNALMTACARFGRIDRCRELFHTMKLESIEPDEITYSALLKACSHGGLVDEARCYFHLLQEQGIEPRLEHLCCIVDVTTRLGFLPIAEELIETFVDVQNSPVAWATLLAAYRSHHGRITGANLCANRGFELDRRDSSHHILLASIYTNSDTNLA